MPEVNNLHNNEQKLANNNLFDSKVQEIPSLPEQHHEEEQPQIDFFGTGLDDNKSDKSDQDNNMFNGNDFDDLEKDFEH